MSEHPIDSLESTICCKPGRQVKCFELDLMWAAFMDNNVRNLGKHVMGDAHDRDLAGHLECDRNPMTHVQDRSKEVMQRWLTLMCVHALHGPRSNPLAAIGLIIDDQGIGNLVPLTAHGGCIESHFINCHKRTLLEKALQSRATVQVNRQLLLCMDVRTVRH